MGRDLGGFLSLYGALVDGNGLGWSISGGPREGIGGTDRTNGMAGQVADSEQDPTTTMKRTHHP